MWYLQKVALFVWMQCLVHRMKKRVDRLRYHDAPLVKLNEAYPYYKGAPCICSC